MFGSKPRRTRRSNKRFRFAVALGLWLATSLTSASAYSLLGSSWPGPTIPMRVQLGPSGIPLADGSASYDASIENALALWNEQLGGIQFTWTVAAPSAPVAFGDRINSMQLSSKVYGDKFGSGVLAITLTDSDGSQTTETDVLFNTANQFNSYRNTAYTAGTEGYFDIHRIALHELGHVLGLDHPDEHGQTVDAIMNANVSTLDSLQADDIAGVVALYGAPPNPPAPTGNGRLAQLSTRGSVGTGDMVMIGGFIIPGTVAKTVIVRAIGPSLGAFGVSGALQNPVLELHDGTGAVIATNDDWRTDQEQEIDATGLAPSNDLESVILADLAPGNYTAIVTGNGGATGVALVEVYDLEPESGKLGNISTRAEVGVGDDALIGGFIVTGPQSEILVIRGIGPSLTASGVTGALSDPTLEIYNSNGDLFRSNDNYTTTVGLSALFSLGLAPTNGLESAVYFEGGPGNYTAILRGVGGASGVGLIEVYGAN
jgi:hypothetical protein